MTSLKEQTISGWMPAGMNTMKAGMTGSETGLQIKNGSPTGLNLSLMQWRKKAKNSCSGMSRKESEKEPSFATKAKSIKTRWSATAIIYSGILAVMRPAIICANIYPVHLLRTGFPFTVRISTLTLLNIGRKLIKNSTAAEKVYAKTTMLQICTDTLTACLIIQMT